MENSGKGALVLFSGGQDSAVCLAWALERYEVVETVGFDYGQRHDVELACRSALRDGIAGLGAGWAVRLGLDHEVDLRSFGALSDTALTAERKIEMTAQGLPNTFVPGRNLAFFVYAAAIAYRRGLDTLVGGMCETDYSGYPDCREGTMRAMESTLSLGLGRTMRIETPLMWIDKAGTWTLAEEIGGPALVDLIIEQSHTCYTGDRSHRHEWGYGCGNCPACELRAAGYEKYRAAAG